MQGADLRGYVGSQSIGPETYSDYKGLQAQPTSDSPEALKKAVQ